eukprot:COSAG05_NODE_1215_length_5490_cov_153.169542_4_plen_79_part_00
MGANFYCSLGYHSYAKHQAKIRPQPYTLVLYTCKQVYNTGIPCLGCWRIWPLALQRCIFRSVSTLRVQKCDLRLQLPS